MDKRNKITKYIYISLFAALYLSVALVSGIHAVAFFSLANAKALGVMLAVTFEIGQAAVLFSLLTNPEQRKKVMTWVQLSIFTLIQILGNVYSSYKYIVTNSIENLRFFREPVFVWTDLPDQTCNVIITYLVGGVLPISALMLTEMLTNYLYGKENNIEVKTERDEEPTREVVETNDGKESIYDNNEDIKSEESKLEEEQEHEQEEAKPEEIAKTIETTDNKEDDGTIETDDRSNEEVRTDVKGTDEDDTQEMSKVKSHFLNI